MKNIFYSGPAIAQLHQNIAKKGHIDEHASSVAYDSIEIEADAQTVWAVIFDMASWPTFNPLFSSVQLPNAIEADASASFKLKGLLTRLTFAVVDPGKQLTWTGSILWTKAIDQLVIEPITSTRSRLHLNESLSGFLVPLMSSSNQLHTQHETSLKAYKQAAETKYHKSNAAQQTN